MREIVEAGEKRGRERRGAQFAIVLVAVIVSLIFFLAAFSESAKAQAVSGGVPRFNTTDPREVLNQETGIKKEYIPTDEQDLQELRDKLLREQWERFINNSKYLSAANRFLAKISPVFLVLMARPYEFSPAFYAAFVLWVFILAELTMLLRASEFPSKKLAFPAALATTVLVAWLNIIDFIVEIVVGIIFNPKKWWVKLIIFVIVVTGFAIVHALLRSLEESLKKSRHEKEIEEGEAAARRLKTIEEKRREVQQQAG